MLIKILVKEYENLYKTPIDQASSNKLMESMQVWI
jgi:hypothetical protein